MGSCHFAKIEKEGSRQLDKLPSLGLKICHMQADTLRRRTSALRRYPTAWLQSYEKSFNCAIGVWVITTFRTDCPERSLRIFVQLAKHRTHFFVSVFHRLAISLRQNSRKKAQRSRMGRGLSRHITSIQRNCG